MSLEALRQPRGAQHRPLVASGTQRELDEHQLMQKVEAQGGRGGGMGVAKAAPRCRRGRSAGPKGEGRNQVNGSDRLGSVDADFLRQQIGARPLAFDLAIAGFLALFVVALMAMMAASGGLCSCQRYAVLDALVRVVPAASKCGMDEEHCGHRTGYDCVHKPLKFTTVSFH